MARRRMQFGTGVRSAFDVRRIAAAVSAPGIDPRLWVSYGTVCVVDDDGECDFTDPQAVRVGPEGVEVDVLLEPSLLPVTCHFAGMHAGPAAVILAPIRPGDRVLVTMPGGDSGGPPVISAVLCSGSCRLPLEPDRKPVFRNDRVSVFARDVPIEVRTQGGARVEVLQDGQVILNQGDRGVARIQDTTRLTMSPTDVQALAVQLLTTGGFTPAGPAPAPSALPVTFDGGEITSASGTVKAGG